MASSADLKAINDYIMNATVLTPAAQKVKTVWQAWFHDHANDWWLTEDDWNHSRNLRLQFNTANAITPAEKEAVKAQATTGISTEDVTGAAKVTGSDGRIYEEPQPWIPTKWKIIGALGAIGFVALKYGGSLLNFTPLGMLNMAKGHVKQVAKKIAAD